MSDETLRRQRWLSHLKSFASSQGELHPYGSEAWCLLPDRSWRKIAAPVLLGEAWLQDGETLPQRLEDEFWAAAEFEGAELRREIAEATRAVGRVPKFYEYHAQRLAAGYIPRRLP